MLPETQLKGKKVFFGTSGTFFWIHWNLIRYGTTGTFLGTTGTFLGTNGTFLGPVPPEPF